MDPVYHLDKPRNFNPKLLFVVATGAPEGSAGGRGRMCLRPEWEEGGCGMFLRGDLEKGSQLPSASMVCDRVPAALRVTGAGHQGLPVF